MSNLLTRHFTLAELTRSDTAKARGIENIPLGPARANLEKLAETLEIARYLLEAPLVVHSGYRAPKLNAAVGGAPSSDHAEGLAADFTPRGPRSLLASYSILKTAMTHGCIRADQLICYPKRGHLHLGIGPRMRSMAWIDPN